LSWYHPVKQTWIEIPLTAPRPLLELLEELGIPVAEVVLFVVNGEMVNPAETIIHDEDKVALYPPVGGGSGL
jgi:sulfur carrier protein ThiS